MKKAVGKQLYFSSSDQEMQAGRETMAEESRQVRVDDNIDELSSLQIFEIFYDPNQLYEIIKSQQEHSSISRRFFWRVHYLIGQIIIQVQEYLLRQNKLKDSLLLQSPQIQKIAIRMIQKARDNPSDDAFLLMKTYMEQFYKHNSGDSEKMLALYNEFVKMSRDMLRFEMVLHFESIEDTIRKKQLQMQGVPTGNLVPSHMVEDNASRMSYGGNSMNHNFIPNNLSPNSSNPNSRIRSGPSLTASRLPQQSIKSRVINGVSSSSSFNGLRGTINGKSQTATAAPVQQQIEKGGNRKWSSTEQAVFCKIYSETDSPMVCVQLMQKQVGADGRWRTPNQIEVKMYALVTKVFNKFAALNTNNEYIKVFRENREMVLNGTEPSIRKKIFRNIAIIYESMLNVSEEKKQLISTKILEVNRLCREAALMK